MNDEAAELTRLSSEWMDAARRHDEAKLREIMAPEYTLQSRQQPAGYIDREAWLQNLSQIQVSRYDVSVQEVSVVGPVALVRSRQSWASLPGSRMPSADAEVVDVWARISGGWKILRRQVIHRSDPT